MRVDDPRRRYCPEHGSHLAVNRRYRANRREAHPLEPAGVGPEKVAAFRAAYLRGRLPGLLDYSRRIGGGLTLDEIRGEVPVKLGWNGSTLVVTGELDLSTAAHFELACEQATVDDELRIDMAGCAFIDSTTIAVLIRRLRAGVDVVVVNPSRPVRRTLHVVGLDDPAYLTIEDAA